MKPRLNLLPLRRLVGWATLVIALVGLLPQITVWYIVVPGIMLWWFLGWLHRKINAVTLKEELPLYDSFTPVDKNPKNLEGTIPAGKRVFIGPPEKCYYIRGEAVDRLARLSATSASGWEDERGIFEGWIESEGVHIVGDFGSVQDDEIVLCDETLCNINAHMTQGTMFTVLASVTFAYVGYKVAFVEDIKVAPATKGNKSAKKAKALSWPPSFMKMSQLSQGA